MYASQEENFVQRKNGIRNSIKFLLLIVAFKRQKKVAFMQKFCSSFYAFFKLRVFQLSFKILKLDFMTSASNEFEMDCRSLIILTHTTQCIWFRNCRSSCDSYDLQRRYCLHCRKEKEIITMDCRIVDSEIKILVYF